MQSVNRRDDISEMSQPKRSLKVLVLEDEELMSALLGRYLQGVSKEADFVNQHGSVKIEVLSLSSGFDLLTQDLSGYDVAIVDMLLPQITGVDLIRDFRKRFPRLGLVPISGMATDTMKRQLKDLLPEGVRLLEKPLRKESFFEAFSRALLISKQPPQQPQPSPSPLMEGGEEPWTAVRGEFQKTVSVEKRPLLRKRAA
jgi:CheY-like chemotaxis protein